MVGESFYNMIKQCSTDPSRIEVLNETLIALVPKTKEVVNLK